MFSEEESEDDAVEEADHEMFSKEYSRMMQSKR